MNFDWKKKRQIESSVDLWRLDWLGEYRALPDREKTVIVVITTIEKFIRIQRCYKRKDILWGEK